MQNKNIDYGLLFENINLEKNPVLIAMHNVGSLGIKRGLQKHGVDIIAISHERYLIEALGNNALYIEDKNDWIKYIIKIAKEFRKVSDKKIVFFTDGDQTMDQMLEHFDEIKDYYILPIKEKIEEYKNITDKKLLKNNLKNIRVPKTYTGDSQYKIEEFPVMIKPLSHTLRMGKKVLIANDKTQLKEYLDELSSKGGSISQEVIEGETENLYCITMYRNEFGYCIIGNIVKKLREYPIENGTGSCHITVDNKKLADLSVKLLEEKDYTGIAMIEFKYSEKYKEFVLIEVNGRFPIEANINDKIGNDFVYRIYKDMLNPNKEKEVLFDWSKVSAYWVLQSYDIRACMAKKIDWKSEYKFYKEKGYFIDSVKDKDDILTYKAYKKELILKAFKKIKKKIFGR